MSPAAHHTSGDHHVVESEQILSTLGALGASDEEAIREVLVALVHPILSCSPATRRPDRTTG